jgi:hypothetical protein
LVLTPLSEGVDLTSVVDSLGENFLPVMQSEWSSGVFFPSDAQRQSWNQMCPGADVINCPEAGDEKKQCIAANPPGSGAGFTGTTVSVKVATEMPCNPCRASQLNKQIAALTAKPECFSPAIVDVTEIKTDSEPNPVVSIAGNAVVNVYDPLTETVDTKTFKAFGPQAGANVTLNHKGNVRVRNANMDGSALRQNNGIDCNDPTGLTDEARGPCQPTDVTPITKPYSETALCPVNVHWHLGAEHYSHGEYSCNDKCGPTAINTVRANDRKLAAKGAPMQMGFQCNRYDANDEKFTTEYDWKFCDAYDPKTGRGMQVGQTYEVHWPHSSLGSCGTPYQYQYPFPDGVFCNVQALKIAAIDRQTLASNIGVQGQVFTVVNDENYYFPNMLQGMIVNKELGMGTDMTIYTGSTTGQSVNNTNHCSMYNPVTWQVDRKCHLISASSFDKLCADMRSQRDDMAGDITPHGSRAMVVDELAADNHGDFSHAGRQLRTEK